MIPTWIKRRATPEFIAEVIRHMKQHHTGRTHSAKLDTLIVEMIGPEAFDRDAHIGEAANRLMRLCFEQANQEHGGLIVSDTTAGYWWSDGSREDMDAIDKLESRAKTILANAANLRRNIQQVAGGQVRMM